MNLLAMFRCKREKHNEISWTPVLIGIGLFDILCIAAFVVWKMKKKKKVKIN